MTRRDYELIAEVFAKSRQSYGGRTDSVLIELAEDMANALAEDNERFDKTRFIEAVRSEQ